MFAGPATILFAAVVIVPFFYGLYLTFTSWDGVAANKPFVGLQNYKDAFADIAYWDALGRTIVYSVISVVLVNIVAFALAYLVTSGLKGPELLPRRLLHSKPYRWYRSRLRMEVHVQPRIRCYRNSSGGARYVLATRYD